MTEGVHSSSRPRSSEDLLEETRQRLNLVEETREEFPNLYTPRVESLNGREGTHMTRSVEGAQAWGELFVLDTLVEWVQVENITSLEDFFTPNNALLHSTVV